MLLLRSGDGVTSMSGYRPVCLHHCQKNNHSVKCMAYVLVMTYRKIHVDWLCNIAVWSGLVWSNQFEFRDGWGG